MNPLVFQTDFGLVDGAVSAMYGVAYSVEPELKIHDLTHDITPFNIWEASYRLILTINYWPEGTVFVSVVDPGVGSDRKSVVVKTNSGRYIVTPDNGTLTHVIRLEGIKKRFQTKAGELEVLHGVSADIKKGEVFGIIGLSGAGKSTLVRCINLLERPTGG